MDLIYAIFIVVVGVLASIATGLLKDEVSAFLPTWTDRVLRLAVRLLPERERDRYSEEWRSHIQEYSGKLTKLAQSFRCVFAGIMLNEAHRNKIKQYIWFYLMQVVSGSIGLAFNIYNTERWPTTHQSLFMIVFILILGAVAALPTQFFYLKLHRRLRRMTRGS